MLPIGMLLFFFHKSSKTISVFLATPPNAMIFASGNVRIIDLIKVGFGMKLIGMVIILIASITLITPIFRIHELSSFVNETSLFNHSFGHINK